MYILNTCHAKVQINNTDCNILSIHSLTKIRWSVYGNRLRKENLKKRKKKLTKEIPSLYIPYKIAQ